MILRYYWFVAIALVGLAAVSSTLADEAIIKCWCWYRSDSSPPTFCDDPRCSPSPSGGKGDDKILHVDTSAGDDSKERPSALGSVRVAFDPTNVYSRINLDSNVVDKVGVSTELKVLKETDYWVYVETPKGIQGWIAKKWIKGEEQSQSHEEALMKQEIIERCTCWYHRGSVLPISCKDSRCEPVQRMQ
jgi:hypothetical protein